MSPEPTINVLMTGGGAPGAAGILKCLQFHPNFEIVIADANPNAVGRWLHAEFEIIPYAHEKEFVRALLSVCERRNIHVILPLVTKELIPLAQHMKEFEELGTKVLVSRVDSLEVANNKSRLYQFLEWRGIDLPLYRVVDTVEQFETAVKALDFPHLQV